MDIRSRFLPALVCLVFASAATRAAAAAPTLTTISPLAGATEDTVKSIPYATLLAASDASGGGTISFRFKSLISGTLKKGGANVSLNDTLGTGETWSWTPAADANGSINAFRVRAFDGTDESATDIVVTIAVTPVNDPPSFTKGANITVNESSAAYSQANWATAISPGPANESGQSVQFVIVSNNHPEYFSAGPALSATGTLTFTPAQYENGVATIGVKLTDNGLGNDESAIQIFNITLTPVADPPVLGGTLQGTISVPLSDALVGDTSTAASQEMFGLLTITDPDDNKPNPELLTVTVTVSNDAALYGTFTLPNSTNVVGASSTVYTLANLSPALAQTRLRAARFTPAANAMPVGIYPFDVTVGVKDLTLLQATPVTGSIHVESVNDAPLVAASLVPAAINDSGEATPFRLTVSDPDPGDTFSVTLTETTATPRGTLVLPTNPIIGTASGVSSAMQNVRYQPFVQTSSQTATFQVGVTDVHSDSTSGTPVNATLSLTITFVNNPPEFAGITTELLRTTTDPAAPPVYPFSTVTITDPDPGQSLTLTLALDDPGKGTFSGAGINALGQITGTAAEVTAKLRAVRFTPVANRIPVNQSETATITITVSDGSTTRTNNLTRIEVTSVNGAPNVLWDVTTTNVAGVFPLASNPALIDPSPSAKPFAKVELADDGVIIVTVTMDTPAKGLLQNLGGFAETSAGSRVYRFTGTAADAQSAIRDIQFVPSASYVFPPGQPGRTDFTITASDSALNLTTRLLPIVLVSDTRNFMVTSQLDDVTLPGTLRHAVAAAKNNDVITFALASYPAVIRLNVANGPLVLTKHLSFRGPGADKLSISGDSNANGTTDVNDVQLFRVLAGVRMKGLHLTRGFADTGGAIAVDRQQPAIAAGTLVLEDCIISNCLASQWGGAIDIVEGSLTIERCLFENNSLNASSGLGGGAVSLYTNAGCSFVNTTFSGNSQAAPTGYGGGAIYVENYTPNLLFQTQVTHCTFAGNLDASNKGSSIHSNVSNTRVLLTNSVFGDFSARNLQVAGGGEIVSKGGNLSNDNTTTTLIQGGVPQLAVLLNRATDQCNTDPLLAPLATLDGQTRGHRLLPNSPAAAAGVAGLTTTDQRGVIRNATTDSGAVDADALGRLLVHEIFAPQTTAHPHFIEFFNPRDQVALDLSGFEIWIDGLKRHVFTSSQVIQPGHGIILADSPTLTPVAAHPNTPIILPSEAGLTADLDPTDLDLTLRGRIELRAPSPTGAKVVEAVSYVAVFANSAAPATSLDTDLDSITLAPQFQGAAFVPHGLVQPPPNGGVLLGATGAHTSPGADAGGTPFGEANAYPIGVTDRLDITEDDVATLDVLANDLDADGSDELFIVDLNTAVSAVPPATNKSSITTSPTGAPVVITPVAAPLRGTAVNFDPRVAFNSLPEGARVTERFAYSIIDVGGGAVAGYATGGANKTLVTAPSHRLATGEIVELRDAGIAAYNGSFTITAVDDNTFSIAVSFTGNPGPSELGHWQAAAGRSPSARAEALVEVTVLGRNDPPTPVTDAVATNEDTILRIFADPNLAGIGTSLDTDVLYPQPRQVAAIGVLTNDTDPDSADNPFTQLRVVGVCKASPVSGFSGTPGVAPVTVTAPAHGLQSGTSILISGYGGHRSYNGYQVATVTGPDTFTLPIGYVDNAAQKGLWTVLNDGNRLATTSDHDADVMLEIRANRIQTNVIYNPRPSSYLNGLAQGESATDNFYYAAEDSHGAVSLCRVSVQVAGVNDAPVPGNDPPGLAAIDPLLIGGLTLPQFLAGSPVLYILPAGQTGQVNATIRPAGGTTTATAVIAGLDHTDEDTALAIPSARLLDNDLEVDVSNIKRIEVGAGQNLSREGAAISLSPDGATVTYNPTLAPKLQALAFKERVIDSFYLTVFDGVARVNSLVAVLVEGRNDQPVASNATFTTPEKSALVVNPPGLLLSGLEIDQNTKLPDNRKFLLPVDPAPTTIFGAMAGVTMNRRDGVIDGFAPVSGTPGASMVISPAHGLQSGEEVIILGSGALTGQYVLTRIDADNFSVPVTYDSGFASLAGGTWQVLASVFHYDPLGSVFSDSPGGPTQTLQGLAAGQSYTDTFTYTLLDGSFLFANDDIYRIEADRSSIELRVLDNDTNLDGLAGNRRIVEVSPPSAGGAVVMNGDESLIYTPETGFVGDEVFVYTIEDDLGNRDQAMVTVRVTVDRLNGNLRANDDHFTVAAGQAPLLDVLANDNLIPATGDPLALVAVAVMPDHGGQAVVENGKIRYTPAGPSTPSYTESFSYTMSGGGSATATATVTVLVVNRADTLNMRADAYSVPASSSHVTLNVLENDNILPGNGEALTIIAVGTPAHGSATILNGVALSYTPPAGFLGTDTFSYTAADGFGGTGTAVVTVKVGYLTTNHDIFSVRFDDPAKTIDDGFTELDVLANDNVLQGGGGLVTITGVTPPNPALGAMTIAPGGTGLRFDPAVSATGQLDFVYTVTDSGGRSATGTVTVVVLAGGIRASSDFFTVQTGSQAAELPVLSNDLRISDLPGQLSIATIGTGVDAPDQGGTVEISADYKKLVYTPATGFSGVESFTYTVTDGDSSDTARVSVRATDGEMVASPDSFLIFRGSTDNRLAVLLNDRVIPDAGQSLFITAIGMDPGNLTNPPHRGTLEIIENGVSLRYTPSPDNTVYPFVETFSYEISAGGTARVETLIRLEVLDRIGARNLETNHDGFTVRGDSLGTLLPVLANDSVLPASADAWTITEVTPPTANVCSPFLLGDFPDPAALAARLAAQADQLALYLWGRITPAARTVLANPATAPLQTRITLVAELNTIVEAGTSIYDPARFTGITLRAQTQSLLDQGVTGEQLIVLNRLLLEDAFPPSMIRQATGGGAVQISGANILYAPPPGFVGTERFTYRVGDGLGGTGFAEVIVRVGDISVSDDAYTVLANGGPVSLDVTANDGILRTAFPATSQPAQADFTLAPERPITVAPASAGSAVADGTVVRFTPSAAFAGRAVMTYWVDDDSACQFPGTAYLDIRAPGGDRDSAVVSIIVTGVNDPPKLLNADPGATTDKNSTHPFANTTVVEYDDQRAQPVTIRVSYPATHGVLAGGFSVVSPGVLEFNGTAAQATAALRALVFTPVIDRITVGQTEDTQFSVTMDDGFVTTPVLVNSVVTQVTPVNDPPVITGTVAAQKVYQYSSLRPFAGVNITDPDDLKLQPQTVTVQLDSAIKGGFSNLGGFVQTPVGSGIYVFTGPPATAAAALRGLLFVPTPGNRVTATQPEIVGLSITVNDGFAPPVVNALTTVVVTHAEVDRLLPLDALGQDASQTSAAFGTSVAVSGDTMVVGSPKRNTPAIDAGRVFVYERNAGLGAPWGQVAEIAAADAFTEDAFGQAVAVDGDLMAIGAPRANVSGIIDAGAVYIFRRNPADHNSWLQAAKLVPSVTNAAGGDLFGSAVALQGNTLLVGTPNANFVGALRSGRVFVFQLGSGPSNWTQSQILTASVNLASGNSGDGEYFGCSLAMDGNTAVIGAYGANRGTNTDRWDYGAAYLFSRTAAGQPWSETKRFDEFTDPAARAYDGFGFAVAIDGDRIAVGVHSVGNDSTSPIDFGRVRIYERDYPGANQWGLAQKVLPSDGLRSFNFGSAVALSGDLLLIGSPGATTGVADNRGFAEIYRRTSGAPPTWSMIDRVAPSAAIATDRFGYAVALDGFSGIVGAHSDSINSLGALNAGSARVYQFQYDLGPRLTIPVADQLATEQSPFTFAVNPATFDDPIYPAALVVTARLANGNPLPAAGWLSFNPATATFSGTPTAANRGAYDLVLVATNPLGSAIVSNVFHITVDDTLQSAYQLWAATRFPAPTLANPALEAGVWGMSANPDGDGSNNLLEMLFGTLPDQANPTPLTFQRLSASQSSLTFPLAKDFPMASLHVEWAADMTGWSRVGVAMTTQEDIHGILWVTATITPPAPQSRLFVRVAAGP